MSGHICTLLISVAIVDMIVSLAVTSIYLKYDDLCHTLALFRRG